MDIRVKERDGHHGVVSGQILETSESVGVMLDKWQNAGVIFDQDPAVIFSDRFFQSFFILFNLSGSKGWAGVKAIGNDRSQVVAILFESLVKNFHLKNRVLSGRANGNKMSVVISQKFFDFIGT